MKEESAQHDQLKKLKNNNTLTICSSKKPAYYQRLIRLHLLNETDKDTIVLQALGQGCQNLVFVAALVTLKGYATYKRIKNDHISVPVIDSATGEHLKFMKKVRLTVKLRRAENFAEIVQREVLAQQ